MEQVKKPSEKNKTLRVGITGGIGSGKSVIAEIFKVLDVPVYNADKEAKRLLASDQEVMKEVVNAFGERAYRQGVPDRTFLADAIFSDHTKRERLNTIIHPAVARDFESFVRKNAHAPYVIKEAAITVETGMHEHMDAVILVSAPEELRIKRVVERDKTTPDKVRERMSAQWPDERKRPFTQFEVVNDEIKPVIPAVLQIHNAILRNACG